MISSSTLLFITGVSLISVAMTQFSSTEKAVTRDKTNINGEKQKREIGSFTYYQIKDAIDYTLIGTGTFEFDRILRDNYIYSEEERKRIINEGRFVISRMLANKAQYGNKIYPSYLRRQVEDYLNKRYNK